MTIGAVAEPLVVIFLLFGGTWINRRRVLRSRAQHRPYHNGKRDDSPESGYKSGFGISTQERERSLSPSSAVEQDGWRRREISILGYRKEIRSPDTAIYGDRILSRLLFHLPFLVEVWYWALIYWVYQLGRAVSALTLVDGTVDTARRHALQVVRLEQRLLIFIEPQFQQFFLRYPTLMHWINNVYSFVHIPATILFLVWLYYQTIASNTPPLSGDATNDSSGGLTGAALYQARRRTMAMCNLLAFVVFTLWPCMPPRLLSDPNYSGLNGKKAQSFGFVDTVHSVAGQSSIWTQNKFCNQYAAMPSLHFGYSLLVGLTIASIPLAPQSSAGTRRRRRFLAVLLGTAYPAIILIAIVATANHFILDAVAGAIVCLIACNANGVMLNLLPLEDWFLWALRLHKPDTGMRVDVSIEAAR